MRCLHNLVWCVALDQMLDQPHKQHSISAGANANLNGASKDSTILPKKTL